MSCWGSRSLELYISCLVGPRGPRPEGANGYITVRNPENIQLTARASPKTDQMRGKILDTAESPPPFEDCRITSAVRTRPPTQVPLLREWTRADIASRGRGQLGICPQIHMEIRADDVH